MSTTCSHAYLEIQVHTAWTVGELCQIMQTIMYQLHTNRLTALCIFAQGNKQLKYSAKSD